MEVIIHHGAPPGLVSQNAAEDERQQELMKAKSLEGEVAAGPPETAPRAKSTAEELLEPAPRAKVAEETVSEQQGADEDKNLARAAKSEEKKNRSKTRRKKGGQENLLDDDDFLKQALLQAQAEGVALNAVAKFKVDALEPVIAKQRAVCPEGHPLVAKAVPVAEGKACWKCMMLFPAGDAEANCSPCEFSLCKVCVSTFGGGDGAQTLSCS